MGKIICLMGKSSTGKDTIFKELLAEDALGLKTIVPYTTRPIRAGEKNGREYFFASEADYQRLKQETKSLRRGLIRPITDCGDTSRWMTGRYSLPGRLYYDRHTGGVPEYQGIFRCGKGTAHHDRIKRWCAPPEGSGQGKTAGVLRDMRRCAGGSWQTA